MNVLSLFDGISCARIALDHSGIAVGKYYASEIDKFAIKVSKHNYPDIIHLGDVSDWVNWDIDWSSIDLVIGGFPCQSFSLAGKHGGFDDPRGQLFFKQVEIIKHIKSLNPNVKFIVENVILNDDNREVVDIALGTKPVIIDSALVSAQLRKRMYWCNFEVDQPHDCGIYYQDILEDGEAALLKAYTLTATYYKRGSAETRLRQWNRSQRPIVWLGDDETRWLYPVEAERLQTVPQYVKRVEVLLCSDQAESFVAAVEKNPKLLKLVVSAESEKLKEYVKHANRNTSVNPVKIKFTALQNADTRTQKQTGKCTKVNQKEQSLTANSAENTLMYKQAGSGGSSVTESVFIDITEGLITHLGGGESHQKEQPYTEQMNGKVVLSLSGNETMQSARDVLSVLEMMQTNHHSISITDFRLSTKNLEQILTISYWFAKNATDGFTQSTTQTRTLYLNLIDGYTRVVSDTKRLELLGNGFTVKVISHILSQMMNEKVDVNSITNQ